MSKKKDVERAEKEGRFRERFEKKDETCYVCPFPGCGKPYFKEEGKSNACNYHRQFISDFLFCAFRLAPREEAAGEKKEEKKGPVILVPKPGMTDKAIQEALKRRGS